MILKKACYSVLIAAKREISSPSTVGAVQCLGAEWRPTFPPRPSSASRLDSGPGKKKKKKKKRKHATCCCTEVFSQEVIKPTKKTSDIWHNHLQRPCSSSKARSILLLFYLHKSRQHDDMIIIFTPGEAGRGGKGGCLLMSLKTQSGFEQLFSFNMRLFFLSFFFWFIIFVLQKYSFLWSEKHY